MDRVYHIIIFQQIFELFKLFLFDDAVLYFPELIVVLAASESLYSGSPSLRKQERRPSVADKE
jgi:hypothetical protein